MSQCGGDSRSRWSTSKWPCQECGIDTSKGDYCESCWKDWRNNRRRAKPCEEAKENQASTDHELTTTNMKLQHSETAEKAALSALEEEKTARSFAREELLLEIECVKQEQSDLEASLEGLKCEKIDMMRQKTELATTNQQMKRELEVLLRNNQDCKRLIMRERERMAELFYERREAMNERLQSQRIVDEAHKAVQKRRADIGQWQYEINDGEEDWGDMLEATCRALDDRYKAHREGRSVSPVTIINNYKFDFSIMKQENMSTEKTRRIRVIIVGPEKWTRELTLDNYMHRDWDSVSRFLDFTETQMLSVLLKTFCPGTCPGRESKALGVWRVENWPLWTAYQGKLRSMRMEYDKLKLEPAHIRPRIPQELAEGWLEKVSGLEKLDGSLNEVYLFHGTRNLTDVQDITSKGFDYRLARKQKDPTGHYFQPLGFYGQGTYFAENICKSMQYMRDEAGRLVGSPIVARVVLGDVNYTKQVCRDLACPPVNDRCAEAKKQGIQYDTVVANVGPMAEHPKKWQAHRKFVIFDKAQAYPEFVIQFEQ